METRDKCQRVTPETKTQAHFLPFRLDGFVSIYQNIIIMILAFMFLVVAFFGNTSVLADTSPDQPISSRAPTLQTILLSSSRSQQNRDRDQYRHPLETLTFFGLRPTLKVVELWPGNGWYTQVLAPFLAQEGQLTVTSFDPAKSNSSKLFLQKLAANPTIFGKVNVVEINPPDQIKLAPDSSLDMVLTFRNIHNWVGAGYAESVYIAAYRALKPGGILGVEEHRAKPGTSPQESSKTGYMSENDVITAVERVGFRLVAKSEINANPKDTKDYPDGVWTLPPTLSQGETDQQRYLDIGESDRMTLKFVKPKDE
jgi:predicted methyltransferase